MYDEIHYGEGLRGWSLWRGCIVTEVFHVYSVHINFL